MRSRHQEQIGALSETESHARVLEARYEDAQAIARQAEEREAAEWLRRAEADLATA